jgi:hypothetical protein
LKWWETSIPAPAKSGGQNEKLVRAVTRTNAEAVAFTCQRMQALVGVPGRLAKCRTPYDLMTEQTRFWQTAMDQYNAAAQAVVDAWTPVMPMLAALPTVSPGPRPLPQVLLAALAPSAPVVHARDVLTLVEPVAERQRQAA